MPKCGSKILPNHLQLSPKKLEQQSQPRYFPNEYVFFHSEDSLKPKHYCRKTRKNYFSHYENRKLTQMSKAQFPRGQCKIWDTHYGTNRTWPIEILLAWSMVYFSSVNPTWSAGVCTPIKTRQRRRGNRAVSHTCIRSV